MASAHFFFTICITRLDHWSRLWNHLSEDVFNSIKQDASQATVSHWSKRGSLTTKKVLHPTFWEGRLLYFLEKKREREEVSSCPL